ncbi:hypothetical protein GGR42_000239 [Saonia flava]|uniref:VWA domain-containing protein n=1 Tax=Saonia flava TaxID=523696 RepID=A0A846QRF8_9FLAO|nr:VWA domain-containing protein [Saonia flava]NJB69777.1 hypothetical protein [Saonia flava]
MQTKTLLLIILSAIVALVIAWFQYYYKSKKRGKLKVILSFLRFMVIFGSLLLLINPKFSKNEYSLEKANLLFLVDNSSSMSAFLEKDDALSILNELDGNSSVADKFNIAKYTFGSFLNTNDSIMFQDRNTNISNALKSLNEVYDKGNTAIVLITDGNQTIGEDYEFYGQTQDFPLYPIVVGDTTTYEDLRIGQVNVNNYAFLKNKYPLEAYVTYDGTRNISSKVTLEINGKNVYSENIELSPKENSKKINALLDANTVGFKRVLISLAPILNEKNIQNNSKNVALEVIDEKTEVIIISNLVHPDIGVLKKAIESNEQRSVQIRKPTEDISNLEDADLIFLYQPNTSFQKVYDFIEQRGINNLTITGPKTDWNFLNKAQNSVNKNDNGVIEDISPILNPGFSIFNISDFSIQGFPPLESELGELFINKPYETLLGQQIKGVDFNEPLMAVIPGTAQKEAFLFGENIWKWRMQVYRNDRSFKKFDDFIGKIVLYLAAGNSKDRLNIDYETIYSGSEDAKITASYFDEILVFDPNASLVLNLRNNDISTDVPMLLKGNHYESDLSNLEPGKYDFTITVLNENISKSGHFEIVSFDVEQQFLSSNYKKLKRLAENTGGILYYPNQVNSLTENLLQDKQYTPVQKSKQNIVSLIDFRFLLGIIILALAAEWFIRKYNGLT